MSGFEVLNKIVKGELISLSKNVIYILRSLYYKPPRQWYGTVTYVMLWSSIRKPVGQNVNSVKIVRDPRTSTWVIASIFILSLKIPCRFKGYNPGQGSALTIYIMWMKLPSLNIEESWACSQDWCDHISMSGVRIAFLWSHFWETLTICFLNLLLNHEGNTVKLF